jgi:lambda repressor-like predicted transcriptional regulator
MMTDDIPTEPRERNVWLKYRMELAGFGFADLARDMGLHRGTPQEVLRRPYPRMETEIAKRLGVKPEKIWPERYADRARRQAIRHAGTVAAAARARKAKRLARKAV